MTTTSADCEKADLESGEKERSFTSLTLPIPSVSNLLNTNSNKCSSLNNLTKN